MGASEAWDSSLLWIKTKTRNGVCYATVTQINFGDEMKTAPQGSWQKYGKEKKKTLVRRKKRAVLTEETPPDWDREPKIGSNRDF